MLRIRTTGDRQMMIVTWKKNGLKLRVIGEIKGRFGELRIQVQKVTADPGHGLFSLKPEEIENMLD